MSIQERVVLSTVNISSWGARCIDKDATQEVIDKHNARPDAGRFHKRLLPEHAPSYKAVMAAGQRVRVEHERVSVPWDKNGTRALAQARFPALAQRLNEMIYQHDNVLVPDFVADYQRLREQARAEMNGLFKESDYPADIAGRFKIKWTLAPMPKGGDLRLDIPAEELNQLRARLDELSAERLKEGTADAARRFAETIAAMARTLGRPDAVLRDAVVENVRKMVDLIPDLNMVDDPDLRVLRAEAKEHLCRFDASDLRNDDVNRLRVAREAQRIADALSGVFS